MKMRVTSVAELGLLVRATRRTSGVRLDDLAGCAGVGHVFARDVEHGKPTVQLGRVLQLLDEIGVHLMVELPDSVAPEFERLKAAGLRPLKRRRASPKAKTAATPHDNKAPAP